VERPGEREGWPELCQWRLGAAPGGRVSTGAAGQRGGRDRDQCAPVLVARAWRRCGTLAEICGGVRHGTPKTLVSRYERIRGTGDEARAAGPASRASLRADPHRPKARRRSGRAAASELVAALRRAHGLLRPLEDKALLRGGGGEVLVLLL